MCVITEYVTKKQVVFDLSLIFSVSAGSGWIAIRCRGCWGVGAFYLILIILEIVEYLGPTAATKTCIFWPI